MTKGQLFFKDKRNIIPKIKPEDQNKPEVQPNEKKKKQQNKKLMQKPFTNDIPTDPLQSVPLTSYRVGQSPEQKEENKWIYLTKFAYIASKVHTEFYLKYQTLFLSYSLAQKTINLVLNDELGFEYWAACCLFMSMKYEEIYPPNMKDLSKFVKIPIEPKQYMKSQFRMFEYIDLDMNFISLNTMLSEYLHAVKQKQRYFIFYLLEIALTKRYQLRKYSLKEILLAVMMVLASHRLRLNSNQNINGINFQKISECSKIIIIGRTQVVGKQSSLFRKYRNQKRGSVSTCAIPSIEKLTELLLQKTDKDEEEPKILGIKSETVNTSEAMIDEKDEQEVNESKNQANRKKAHKPRY